MTNKTDKERERDRQTDKQRKTDRQRRDCRCMEEVLSGRMEVKRVWEQGRKGRIQDADEREG